MSGRAELSETVRAVEALDRGIVAAKADVRDAATLKLFFGADPATLAATQAEVHERRLRDCEALLANLADAPHGWRLALECGIGHEREFVRFWSRVSKESPQ